MDQQAQKASLDIIDTYTETTVIKV